MDLRLLIGKIDEIESSMIEQAVANPYQGADAEKFARLSPADQAWYTKGGGRPDLNDPYIAARAPNRGQLTAVAPAAPAPAQAPPAAAPAQAPAAPAQSGMAADNSALLAKLKQLEQLVDKYNTAKPKNESVVNLEQSLVESFGYIINEENTVWSYVKNVGGKLFSKVALPVAAGLAIWTGWTQIQELSPSLTDQQRRAEITKIISKLIAEFGTFYVGAIIGGKMGGVLGGVGAIPGFIAGGIASSYLLGNDVNSIVDSIVNYLYKDNDPATPISVDSQPTATDSQASGAKSSKGDPDISELQTALQKSGAANQDGSPLTIDGILGPNTITAMQKELAGLGAKNRDGSPLTIDGKLGPNTAAAVQKYYLF